MKPPFKIVCALLVAGAVVSVFIQRNALSEAKAENHRLRSESETAARMARENGAIGQLRQGNQEMARLRVENQELHKLRNEVRQLREQTKGLPKVQMENQRLNAAAASQKGAAPPAAGVPPPLTLDQASFAGMATPEATLQSFLWAIRQGDIQAYRNCLTPEQQKELQSRGEEQIRANLREMNDYLKGFRIAAKKQVSADEIQLGVQALGGDEEESMALSFKKIGNEWKLDLSP